MDLEAMRDSFFHKLAQFITEPPSFYPTNYNISIKETSLDEKHLGQLIGAPTIASRCKTVVTYGLKQLLSLLS